MNLKAKQFMSLSQVILIRKTGTGQSPTNFCLKKLYIAINVGMCYTGFTRN
jgi:hypothetical protein